METWARISRNTAVVSREPTRIWSTAARGCHGTVMILMLNRCGDLTGTMIPRCYGGDGRWTGQHDRRGF
ncbi:hypothetical protein AQJ64_16845 [Streptomyces griseoruber]|uniref:Uncharacterized protein n=1 Tax=Streptomyces griseoruber TaxID=1943 RepID=A0A101T121_9ACTN|nr:hypothetical protein AQJ64_16845 [Streptomyces griseoruber]